MSNVKPVPGTNGDQYVPYDQRTGEESVVYFTRDLSADGLKKIYDRIQSHITGKTGVKLHTGEKHGPNIIPRPWVKELMEDKMKDAVIDAAAAVDGVVPFGQVRKIHYTK